MAIGNRALDPALTISDPLLATTPARIDKIISSVLGLLTIAASAWFTIQLLIGAINWIGARGDKAALQNARNHILHAITGLAIVSSSFIIIALASNILGIELINIGSTFSNLRFF